MPGLVEQTAVKAVFSKEPLKFGRADAPHEVWAEAVLRAKNLSDPEVLRQHLLKGKPILDATESDLKGMEQKANGIGKDIDPNTGDITRLGGSPEKKQFDEAKDGIRHAERLQKYESLPDPERKTFADEVVSLLEQRADIKELFSTYTADEKRKQADAFIRTHKKDIADILRENVHIINTDSRFDANSATGEMYGSEEAHAKAQLELDAATAAITEATAELGELQTLKGEYDAPLVLRNPAGDVYAGNKGGEIDLLSLNEGPRLQHIRVLQSEIDSLTGQAKQIEDQITIYKKNPKQASKDGLDMGKLRKKLEDVEGKKLTTKSTQAGIVAEQARLEQLRQEKQSLPQKIKDAQAEIDANKIAEKAKESALKKAADHMRVSREHKLMVDEDLASVTRDLYKNVIDACVDKELDAMRIALTSPEGKSAIMAGALTMLDRKMEEKWSTMHRRIRRGLQFGGRLPGMKLITWENIPLPDRGKINADFKDVLQDTNGRSTEGVVKGLLGKTWDGLTREEQQQTVAAYVTKLVHRKAIDLKTKLRDGEIRALRSGPFANELIKIGLLRSPGFRDAIAAKIPNIASKLDNPTPETLQEIKGALDAPEQKQGHFLTLLMIGLTPLSMMKQEEQK